MRVLHITEAFTGGIVTYMLTVLPRLVRSGITVSLVCSDRRSWPDANAAIDRLRQDGVDVRVMPMSRAIRPWADLRALWRLYRLIRRDKYDIIHTHASKGGALGRIAAWLAGRVPSVHTPHCFAFIRCDSTIKRSLYLWLERFLGLITTRICAVSREEADAAIARVGVPRAKCAVVRNALEDLTDSGECYSDEARVAVRRELGIGADAVVVMTVGRLEWYKGVERFIEVAEASKTQNAIFLVVGDGPLRQYLERAIASRGLLDRISLLGHASDTRQLYLAADIVVLCSTAEGQPYAILEAMRAGRPVIGTNVAGIRELVDDGKTGYMVPDDVDVIANTVDRLASCSDLRNRLGENGYERYRQMHMPSRQVEKVVTEYRDVCRHMR